MQIDVYYDILCPFCFLAKRHLERALAAYPAVPVTLTLNAHMLYPDLPLESHDFRAFFVGKYGEALRVPMWEQVTALGKEVGIDFDFHAIEKGPHAIHGHRVVAFAKRYQKEWAVLDALYSAYYEKAQDLGDHALLVEIGAAHGLPPAELAAYLASDADFEAIFAASRRQTAAGITSMPAAFIDGERVSGEARGGVFEAALARAA